MAAVSHMLAVEAIVPDSGPAPGTGKKAMEGRRPKRVEPKRHAATKSKSPSDSLAAMLKKAKRRV